MNYSVIINAIIERLDIQHLLDFGCGEDAPLKDELAPQKGFKYQAYDPKVERFSEQPIPAEMVVVQGAQRFNVEQLLDEVENLTEVIAFFSIEDDMEIWLPALLERFTVQTVQRQSPTEFFVIAQNRNLGIGDDNPA